MFIRTITGIAVVVMLAALLGHRTPDEVMVLAAHDMTCTAVRGDHLAYIKAKQKYEHAALALGYQMEAPTFATPPRYVWEAVKQSSGC